MVEDNDVAEAEVVEDGATTTDLVHLPAGQQSQLVVPAGSKDEIRAAFEAYNELCRSLLTDADYQNIQGKRFPKKSAWRKLSTAFGTSDRIIDRQYERDEQGRIVRAEVVVEASAPNGRKVEALGACDLWEKCSKKCEKLENHDPASHFSHSQHDIPSTAHTRAKNRALSDLFGMGEISAEEVGEPAQWETLGWPSEAGFRNLMDPLFAALTAAGPEDRDEWKAWRKEHGVGWPVEYAHATIVRQWMGANLATSDESDQDYALDQDRGEKAGPGSDPGTGVSQSSAAPPSPPKITKNHQTRIAILAREVAGSGTADAERHAIAWIVSGGRVTSTKELTDAEAEDAIAKLLDVRDGNLVLEITGEKDEPAKLFEPVS